MKVLGLVGFGVLSFFCFFHGYDLAGHIAGAICAGIVLSWTEQRSE